MSYSKPFSYYDPHTGSFRRAEEVAPVEPTEEEKAAMRTQILNATGKDCYICGKAMLAGQPLFVTSKSRVVMHYTCARRVEIVDEGAVGSGEVR